MIASKYQIFVILLLTAFDHLHAKQQQAETAWPEYDTSESQSGYVFGAFRVRPDFIRSLTGPHEEGMGKNVTDAEKIQVRLRLEDLSPRLNDHQIPRCLPQQSQYRDLSKLMRGHAINTSKQGWILLSGGLGDVPHVYFCLSPADADMMEQTMRWSGPRHPFNFHQQATLISVKNQGLANQPWTRERLIKEKPTVHARFGTFCRSGERICLSLDGLTNATPPLPQGGGLFSSELTLGEMQKHVDCRIEFNSEINGDDATVISFETAFTAELNQPFIIDCGTHGKKQRNYLLKKIPAPLRIKSNTKGEKVYNLTPQLKLLGLTTYSGEWIHYNTTKKQLIIHGSVSIHSRATQCMDSLNNNPQLAKITAKIVEADAQDQHNWTLDLIKNSKPVILAHYSSSAKSGEKAIFGDSMNELTTTDPKTGKQATSRDYEFEIEPTISENSEIIDLRFDIHSKKLGPEKIAFGFKTALTLPDGKPTIIELGHPNSGSRTHLLILHANIITSDGSFHRDRFKPISL